MRAGVFCGYCGYTYWLQSYIIDSMTNERIKTAVLAAVPKYRITRVTLFGSRATGMSRDDSDFDLIVEFSRTVSLLTLASLSIELEQMLGVKVDIVHGPLKEDDIIEVHDQVLLYVAA